MGHFESESRPSHFPLHRTTDGEVSHPEREQVLLPLNQLEEVRRQVARGIRTTHLFLHYHLEQMANKKEGQEAAQIRVMLAEAEDRLR